jgi:hypothetical protein
MRELERRYVRFEERVLKEFTNLRSEITNRMEALERHARGETETLVARIAQESQDRQKDFDSARQTVAKNERELRQAILDASKTLSTELHRVHDALTAELTREVHDLEDDKIARSSLAAMLSDVVVRLNAGLDSGGSKLD